MRAMVLEHTGASEDAPLRLRDIAVPAPGPGQIRIRVRCCGVCHTDLHILEGDLQLPKLPLTPGHQIVGRIDAVGAGVKNFGIGDRVGVPWLYSTCGHCEYCLRGDENLCENARFTGLHVDGGYAEAVVAHEAFAYSVPAKFDDEHAAPLLCAGVIGYRALRLSNARPGGRLGMYGFGASAHIVLQMARHLGCEVYVFTRTPAHRDLALELGAAWVGSAQDKPPALMHSAIMFAPAGSLVPIAMANLRKGGTLAMAGITMSPIPQMEYSLLYHERALRSVANSTREDVRECLRLAAEVPVRTEVQLFELAQANEAVRAMKHSEVHGAGVLKI